MYVYLTQVRVVRAQLLRAVPDQLRQREAAAAVQPVRLRGGAGGVPQRGHQVGLHRVPRQQGLVRAVSCGVLMGALWWCRVVPGRCDVLYSPSLFAVCALLSLTAACFEYFFLRTDVQPFFIRPACEHSLRSKVDKVDHCSSTVDHALASIVPPTVTKSAFRVIRGRCYAL